MTATLRPNPLVALLLGLVAPPLGLHYVGAHLLGYINLVPFALLGLLTLLSPGPGWLLLCLLAVLSGLGSMLFARNARLSADATPPRWVHMVVTVVLTLGLGAIGVRTLVIDVLRVPSAAMAPSVPVGSLLLADVRTRTRTWLAPLLPGLDWRSETPQRGEIWLFRTEHQGIWFKRVIGVPGDHIQFLAGELRVNGESLSVAASEGSEGEEQLGEHRYSIVLSDGPARPQRVDQTLQQDEFWMMGDNRNNSLDSRDLGPVQREALVGRVLQVIPTR